MTRVALVTGAGGGIGRAIATSLASHGAEVLLLDAFAPGCRKVAEEVRSNGGTASAVAADGGTFLSCQTFAPAIIKRGGTDSSHQRRWADDLRFAQGTNK